MRRFVLLKKSVPLVMCAAFTFLVAACSDDVEDEPMDAGAVRDGAVDGAAGARDGAVDGAATARDGSSDVSTDASADRTEVGSDGGAGSGGSNGDSGSEGGDTGGDSAAVRDGGPDGALEAAPESAVDGARDAVSDCGVPGPLVAPTVPTALQPPAGAALARRFYASGSQVYTCTGAPDAVVDGGPAYAWVLKEPSATLYDDSCSAAGTHFAGPTWQSSGDGSSVRGTMAANSPGASGAISWLLLRAVSNAGEGIFSNVTAVQRLDTVGGIAPGNGCDPTTLNTTRNVPYTATYYFYTGGTWPSPEAGPDAAGSSDAAPEGGATDAPSEGAIDAPSDAVTGG